MNPLTLYATTYLLVDVFCIIMATGIVRKVGQSFGSELEIRYFKNFMGFYLLYCLTDALCLPFNCALVPPSEGVNTVLSTINVLAMGLLAGSWYLFAVVKMGEYKEPSVPWRIVHGLPFVALALLCVINLMVPVLFDINAQGAFIEGPLYALVPILSLSCILEVTLRAFRHMRKAQTQVERLEYRAFANFSLPPILACAFDVFVPNTPIVAMGLLASALFVFSTLQETRIFNDSLTGLNNRRRADQYIASKIMNASQERAVYLYVLDVDLFKQINDSKGHIEGDRALRVVAEGLRRAAGESNGFAARWGGDEFLLVVDGSRELVPEEVVEIINRNLRTACDRAEVDYLISVSTGYAVCTSPEEHPDQLMMRADRMLYDKKRVVHCQAA